MYQKVIFLILFPLFAYSQAPQKINFQSILRNTNGEVVANKSVSLKISILTGSISGSPVYGETHTKTTDASGLISIQIGNGTVVSGVFANIAWGNAAHFIKLEADFNGGTNFELLGTQELMSVPYALYASKTDTSVLNLTSRFASKINGTDTVSLSNRIDAKAPINNPTFTGTVGGITQSMVGLPNVDNISDANKPISTATQTTLNTKVNYTDTASMLLNYRIGLNNKLNIADFPLGTSTGNIQYWNGTTWANLSVGQNGQTLILANGLPAWSGAAYATLTTSSISSITSTSANAGGNISSDGGATVSARGLVYGTSANPTLVNTVLSIGSGTGSFSGTISGLTPNTTYYVRAYATNSAGTGYGNEISFQTLPVAVPTLITTDASGITQTTVTSGGTISNDGGATITERGIVYGTSTNPITSNTKITSGSGTGSFSINITALTPNTTYYIRSYAINSAGTGYGNNITFQTTVPAVPSLTTRELLNITNTTATGGGSITNDGGSSITAKGTCWGTSPNPTTSNSKTTDGTGTATFTSFITGLSANVTYYVRAYATNNTGTGYGNQQTFTTSSTSNTLPVVTSTSVTGLTTIQATFNAEVNSEEIEKGKGIERNTLFNLEELKVRWKKAALENCPGIPCITNTVPGAPTGVVATAGVASASVAFTAPSSNGGSVIIGYTVTSSPGSYTATGTSSPINVTGLTNGTAYTFTVVATNAVGNSVPSAASAAVTPAAASSCLTPTITDVDGNVYNTVSIGTQCWTKENLRVRKYNDGVTAIPFDTSGGTTGDVSSTWSATAIGAHTLYAHDSTAAPSNLLNYGYLYNYYAAAGIITVGGTPTKNICPTGYHVPTETEWTTLTDFLGGTGVAGGKMKEAGTTLWNTPNTGATNESGFTVLPGGCRDYAGRSFIGIRNDAFFWSATEADGDNAWDRYLYARAGYIQRSYFNKTFGASVRCLRD